jgi:hypothetical protein
MTDQTIIQLVLNNQFDQLSDQDQIRLCQIVFNEPNQTDFDESDIDHAVDYLIDNPTEFNQ